MARENQGLQIALIVSVMLVIVFMGTTYYGYRQYDEADIKAKSSLEDARKNAQQAKDSVRDAGELKRLIGVADTEKVETITTGVFKEDMNKYGGSYPEEDRVYRRLLERMQETINKRNAELSDAKKQIQGLDQQLKLAEVNAQKQIDEFKKAREDASQDLAGERSKFNAERDRIAQDETKLQTDIQNVRKEKEAEKAKADTKLSEYNTRVKKLIDVTDRQANELDKIRSTKVDAFDGEIRWVDQRSRTVWINLGRADSLPRQITFGVYAADITDLAGGVRKASVEVTQILGDHLAEARVLDDKITDPLVPGDKLHTPLWSQGEKRHFALAGFMDLDGDDQSDLRTVLELIKMNDGVIDCYIDDSGNIVGAMSVNTRYLILGEAPTEKGLPAQIASFSKMTENAKHLGIQTLPFHDMLQRIGWKSLATVTRYGAGAKNLAPKPDEGGQKKSTGNASDVFKPRQPPGR